MERKIADLGEFALLAHVTALLQPVEIPVGLGDDAAAVSVKAGRLLLATTDTLVEEVHFRRAWAKPWHIGYKAMAVNVSDIAAMGGIPTYALVSLAVPGSLPVSWVEEFYRGLEACAAQWGVRIIGGDTVAAREIAVTITLLGETEEGRVLTRSGGRPGDLLLVTGDLGASAAGLEELRAPRLQSGAAARAVVRARHLLPVPRVREGRLLSAGAGAGAVLDLSDGLAQGVREISRASNVGIELYAERLPIAPATREVAAAHGQDPLFYALYGGEDYELLFSLRPGQVPAVREAILKSCGTPVTVIGCLLPPEEGLSLWCGGRRLALEKGGYDHFLR